MTANAAPVLATYLLDTNAAIDIGERYYPQDIFGALWHHFNAALAQGRLRLIRASITELRAGPQDPWRQDVYTATNGLILNEGDADIQQTFQKLARAVGPRGLSTNLSDTDLMVLATGEARALPIVTRDTKMRIACERGHCATRSLNTTELFRELGWSFP